ncbi:zinc-binding alcohol dehydrogenase [Microbacterium sp. TPD7012]|uniref:zinc-dependent alcohol dehydrogenase n=1 Tax=Microbacterium sp. TPD7012 TaxID=2171975 RepID=UPI001401FF9A|nr:zinc-binding alcohol dehydrogenase [Microbacterium sp. TPD7012]
MNILKGLRIVAPRDAQLLELPIPELSEDHVLVRTLFSAMSAGTELRMFRNETVAQNPSTFPMAAGYSAVGVVERAGRLVEHLRVGDHVFFPGTHDEVQSIPAEQALIVDQRAPLDQAAFSMLCEVGLHALRRGEPSFGESVAVIGQGIIGLVTIAVAKAWGLRTLAIDLDEARLSIARAVGADVVCSPASATFSPTVDAFSGGSGVDLVIESASSWRAVATAYGILRRRGRLVVVARHTDVPKFNMIADDLMTKEITFTTSYAHPLTAVSEDVMRWTRPRNLQLILDYFAAGKLDVSAAITTRIKPQQIPEIYARLDRGDSSIGGVSIDWR